MMDEDNKVTKDELQTKILIENERKFRLLTENSIDCIWSMDATLRFTYLSPSLEQMLGAKPDEWVGTALHTHFTKKEFLHAGGIAIQALKNFENFKGLTFETKMLNNKNEEVDVEITGKVARDEKGRLLGLQGTTRVITEEKKTREALIESERKLSTLMSNLPGMAYRCKNDEDWTMEFISDGCKPLTGFEPSELINNARISYAGLIHPEDRYNVWKGVNEGLSHRKIFHLTYRIITKSGNEKWVFEQGQGIYGKNTKPALEGFITDISEQKIAEKKVEESLKEKNILLSEIHHRVKNNMQLIISLLELQKAEVSPELKPVLDDISDRIKIFADIHQDLYQTENVSKINIANHIQSIFKNLKTVYSGTGKNIKIAMKIPNPMFSLDIAIPLGLMINELISNSMKHAFNGAEGLIGISIIRGQNGKIRSIHYTDNGSEIITKPEGFGTTLLDAMAAQLQLSPVEEPGDLYKFSFHA